MTEDDVKVREKMSFFFNILYFQLLKLITILKKSEGGNLNKELLESDDELARELTDVIMETCGSCKKGKCDLYELETNLRSTDISLATQNDIYYVALVAMKNNPDPYNQVFSSEELSGVIRMELM